MELTDNKYMWSDSKTKQKDLRLTIYYLGKMTFLHPMIFPIIY